MTDPADAPPGWTGGHPRAVSVVAALLALACWYEFLSAARTAAHSRIGFPWAELAVALIAFGGGYVSFVVALHVPAGGRGGLPGQSRVVASAGLLVALSLGAVLLAVLTFAMHDDATRSSAVQHGGIAATGTATSVRVSTTTQVSQRYGERTVITSVDVVVSLDEAVDGVGVAHLHVNGRALFSKGQRLRVLLDPEDPAYAELPGHPAATSRGWLIVLLASVVAWLVLIAGTVKGIRRAA